MFYEGCTIEEIKAFRALDSKPFDFGEGLIYPSDIMGSEDAYYEMDLQEAEEDDLYIKEYLNCLKGQIKERPNKYLRKRKHKKAQFKKIDVYTIKRCFMSEYDYVYGYSKTYPYIFAYTNDKGIFYIKRFYKAKRIKFLKAYANRRVRHTMIQYGKGRTYCKEFDLWRNYD